MMDSDDEERAVNRKLIPAAVTPLPKRQIFTLASLRFCEPLCYNVSFPFINEMLVSFGITNPGYSTGFVDASFAIAQTCSVYFWGRRSDRLGRRPVLLIGLATIGTACLFFGMSKSFVMVLCFKAIMGANGNAASLRSAMAELTDETNQGRAFSFLPVSWSMGAFLAPMIGGFLSRPAERYPSLFGGSRLLQSFPYLLPCCISVCFVIVSWIWTFINFEETKGTHRHMALPTSPSDSPVSGPITLPDDSKEEAGASELRALTLDDDDEPLTMSIREIFTDRYISKIIVAYSLMAFTFSSMDPVYFLWLYTPISKGGIGFAPSQIGVLLSFSSVFGFINSLFIFPFLQKRLGTAKLFRTAITLLLVRCSLFPIVSWIARWEARASGSESGGILAKGALAIMIILGECAGMAWLCNTIIVCRAAPSKSLLGSVNGVAQTCASLCKAIGPSLSTIIFALSNDPKYHLLNGYFIWMYFFALATAATWASHRVQEGRGSR